MQEQYPYSQVYRVEFFGIIKNYYPPIHFKGTIKDWERLTPSQRHNELVTVVLKEVKVEKETDPYFLSFFNFDSSSTRVTLG